MLCCDPAGVWTRQRATTSVETTDEVLPVLRIVLGVIALLLISGASAEASHRHHHHHHRFAHHRLAPVAQAAPVFSIFGGGGWTSPSIFSSYTGVASGSRPSDCYGIPWCGCYLRHQFGLADKTLNRAIAWARVGHPTSPHVGAVVVWRHHVGKITGQDPRTGEWVVLSGNDGHAVRERPRSIANAVAFRDL